MTALTLVDEVAADAGKIVLVVGATGGVGAFVTQVAAARGARVIATAGSDRAEWMREFGAADTIDYRQAPVAEQVRAAYPDGVDGLIDTVSEAPAFARVASLVRPGGTAATTVFAADPEALAERDVRGLNLNARMTVALLDRLTAEIDGGRLRIPVETTVPLADAPDALARCRSGHTRGKTVILI
jgi:NADPH:quinone reductase-like Zn-dependent oxidoreductase